MQRGVLFIISVPIILLLVFYDLNVKTLYYVCLEVVVFLFIVLEIRTNMICLDNVQ